MKYDGHDGQLLDRALSHLSPDVFFHPLWKHFVEAEASLSPEQIQSLLAASDEMLSTNNVCDACQTLFVCAFQQLRAGDYTAASSGIRRILTLAEQHELPQVVWWAIWGAAAVCVRQGQFQQAAEHLEHLRSFLTQQHEWVVSDVIDVLRQALLSQAKATVVDQSLLSDAVLSFAFEQLLHWGSPSTVKRIGDVGSNCGDRHNGHATALSRPNGKSLLRTIKRVIKGELRLTWVEAGVSTPPPDTEENRAITPASVISTTLASALMPPHPDQAPTLDQQAEPDRLFMAAQDQEAAAAQSVVNNQPVTVTGVAATPSITAHMLGAFSFSVNDATVQSWPTGKGRAVFKYMLAHHDQPIPRDVLMDVFWPQAGPEAARNSLNVALHGLRQVLKTVTDRPVVLFEEGAYSINSEFHVWIDVDEFDRHVQAGRCLEAKEQLPRAVAEYEAAIELYQGDFLAGDPYEEWPVLPRERLRVAGLDILDRLSRIYFSQQQYAACEAVCQQILARDNCREDAHCLLMRCYGCQGQRHLALRQYQACVEALRSELNVDPAPATTQLYERIRRREHA